MPDITKIVTRDELVAAMKAATVSDGMAIRKAFAAELKAINPDARTIDFVISTASVDRMSDTIAVDGWVFDAYLRSPVVLWAHDSSAPPIAKALSVTKGKNALTSTAEFMSRDLSPFADSIFRMYEQKFLSAVSVGFVPIKYAFSSDNGREWGIDFISQELIEYSCCPVPANPEALVAAKAAGIDTLPLAEWAERILDGEGRVPVPRGFLEETFRAAKTPRAIRQKYLAPGDADATDWRGGADRDLPVAEVEWDAAAAAARIFTSAGFDGDNPDAAMAAKGFLIHDAANPSLKASYRFPFADVVDGGLHAVLAGVKAASGRLVQSDAPTAALDDARAVVARYLDGGVTRAGRKISSETAATIQEAIGHHEAATACLKTLLSDGDADADAGGAECDPADMHDPVMHPMDSAKAAERDRRVRLANALKMAAEAA